MGGEAAGRHAFLLGRTQKRVLTPFLPFAGRLLNHPLQPPLSSATPHHALPPVEIRIITEASTCS
jgi:hypothetical protein